MTSALGLLFVLLLLAALLFWFWSRQQRAATGLPQGRVVYVDTGAWQRVERPLFSQRYALTGKPDYIVDERHRWVPVEVKSRPAPQAPYPSHILQLAAYCLLIEETYGQPPSHGLIHYSDHTIRIDYSPALRAQLLAVLDEMRAGLRMANVARDHDSPPRCRACGYRQHCGQSLT